MNPELRVLIVRRKELREELIAVLVSGHYDKLAEIMRQIIKVEDLIEVYQNTEDYN